MSCEAASLTPLATWPFILLLDVDKLPEDVAVFRTGTLLYSKRTGSGKLESSRVFAKTDHTVYVMSY